MKTQKLEQAQKDINDYLSQLPEELLLRIWKKLATLPQDTLTERDLQLQSFPFRTLDNPCEPHPGLRAYPFLGQVCKKWREILQKPDARQLIWDEVVVDFSHELITAVHTPIAWSDKRPSNEEFQQSFKEIRLDTCKILDFIKVRMNSLRKVVLMSSEGYYSEEGEFVNFASKHDFTSVGFGMLCGMMLERLEELTVIRCSDFMDINSWTLSAIKNLRNLTSLRLEDIKCSEEINVISTLSTLSKLTELSLTTNSYHEKWLKSDKSPSCWLGLPNLQKLTLSGHSHFDRIPEDFARLPLTYLDLSFTRVTDFSSLRALQSLQILSMQSMFREISTETEQDVAENALVDKFLAELKHLTNLTALNLCDNYFTTMPDELAHLTRLEFLDISINETLQVPTPLTKLYALRRLKLVDARFIHKEHGIAYWSKDKCITMNNMSAWQKTLRRRGANVKFLLDGGQ